MNFVNYLLILHNKSKKMRTAFICFFQYYPTTMGSAEVIRSLFLCWPGNKKIFQISHLNNQKKYNLYSLKIFKENSFA